MSESSDVKSANIFSSSIEKLNNVDKTKEAKLDNLGLNKFQETLNTYIQAEKKLEESQRRADPEFRTNPESIFSDQQVRDSLVARALSIFGGGAESAAGLAGEFLSVPEKIRASIEEKGIVNTEVPIAAFEKPEVKKVLSGINKDIKGFTKNFSDHEQFVSKFVGPLHNEYHLNKLTDELREDYKKSEGFVDGVFNMVSTVASNPDAAAEVFVQSLPQMYALTRKGVAGAANFLAITNQEIRKQIETFKQHHDGREPNGEELNYIVGTSVSAVALDKFSSHVVLGTPGLNKIVDSKFVTNLQNTVDKISKKIPLPSTAKRVAVAGPTETIQEGTQEALGVLGGVQDIDALQDPKVREDIYVAAGLGLGGGAFGAAASSIASDVASGVSKTKAGVDRAVEAVTTDVQERKESNIEEALDTGDVETILRETSSLAYSKLTQDKRKEHLEQYANALSVEEILIQDLPEGKEKEKRLKKFQDYESRFTGLISEHQKLSEVEETGTTAIDEFKAVINQETKDVDIAEVQNTINRTLGSEQFEDNFHSEEQIDTILDNEIFKKSSTPEQKAAFEQRKTEIKLGTQVSKDIKTGSSDGQFKGANEYTKAVRDAVSINSEALALSNINKLIKFKDFIQGKLTAIQTGIKEGKEEIEYGGTEYTLGDKVDSLQGLIQTDIRVLNDSINKSQKLYNTAFKEAQPIDETPDKGVSSPDIEESISEIQEPPTPKDKVSEEVPVKKVQTKKQKQVKQPQQTFTETVEKLPIGDPVRQQRLKATQTKIKQIDDSIISPRFRQIRKGILRDLEKAKTRHFPEAKRKQVTERVRALGKEWISAQQRVKGSLAHNILHNNLDDGSGITAETFLEVTDKPKGLLNKIPNLFNNLDSVLIKELLEARSEKEAKAWKDVAKYVRNVTNIVNGTKKSKAIYKILTKKTIYRASKSGKSNLGDMRPDPLSYLVQLDSRGNRYLNENLLATVAVVSYQWLGTEGLSTLLNSPEAINGILKREEGTTVTEEELNVFLNLGNLRNNVAESLGERIYKHLGLKAKKKGIKEDPYFEERLKMALGQLAITTMLESNLIEQDSIDLSPYIKQSPGDFVDSQQSNFIRIKGTQQTNSVLKGIPKDILSISDNLKQGEDILSSLLVLDQHVIQPSDKPIEKVIEKVKNSIQFVPRKVQSTIKRMQKVPFTLKSNMVDTADNISFDSLLSIFGYEHDIKNNTHITEQLSQSAKNEQILREFKHIVEFRGNKKNKEFKPIYFQYSMYKNGRTNITSQTINPQRSKIHRHFFQVENWTEVVNSKKSRDHFKFAVMQSFGFPIDTYSPKILLREFNKLYSSDLIQNAINSLNVINSKVELTSEERAQHEANIVEAVKYGKEGVVTFDALVNLTKFHPRKKFTTNLAIEADGKTNGYAIGLMQAMLSSPKNIEESLSAAGIFTSPITSTYYDYIGKKKVDGKAQGLDSYEKLAKVWRDHVGILINVNKKTKGIASILGRMLDEHDSVTKAARSLSKNPLMITTYGAAVTRVIEEFTDDAIKIFYKNLMDESFDNKKLEIGLKIVLGYEVKIPSQDKVKDWQLTDIQTKALKKTIKETYGEALKIALDSEFGSLNQYRDLVNNATKIMFYIFNNEYQSQIKLAEEDGPISLKQREDIALSLQSFMPIFASPNSTSYKDGILALKTEKIRQYKPEHYIQQSYNKGIRNITNLDTNKKYAPESSTSAIRIPSYLDAGVSAMILAIHNIDSAIISNSLDHEGILNIFDAEMASVSDSERVTVEMNESFYNINKNYSILDSVSKALVDSVNRLNPDQINELNRQISEDKSLKSLGNIYNIIPYMGKISSVSKNTRETVFKDIKHVHQYISPYSSYKVPQEEEITNENVEEKIDEVVEELFEDTKKSFQSSGETFDTTNFNATDERLITPESTVEIFDDLANLGNVTDSKKHTDYLRNLLADLVSRSLVPLGDFEFKLKEAGNNSLGLFKDSTVYMNTAIRNTIGHNTQLSAQEVYSHELIHIISQYAIDKNYRIRKAIKKIFNEAKKVIKPEDFLGKDSYGNVINTPAEMKLAQERYDYIFRNVSQKAQVRFDSKTGHKTYSRTNNYLHEFVAFAATNESFREKLAQIDSTPKVEITDSSILGRFKSLLQKIMQFIGDSFLGIRGIKADKALVILIEEMASVHTKQRDNIYKSLHLVNGFNNKLSNALDSYIFDPLTKFKETKLKDPKTVPGKILNTILTIPKVIFTEQLKEHVQEVSRRIGITEKSFIAKLVREGIGTTAANLAWHTLLRYSKKHIDQARKHLADEITEQIINSFHTEYEQEDSASLNYVLLKSDLISLFDSENYSIQDILDMLNSESKLEDFRKQIKTELEKFGEQGSYYIFQADGLGQVMATGKTNVRGQQLNAYKIATINAIENRRVLKGINERENLIELYASLSALTYLPSNYKIRAAGLIQKEFEADHENNGIITTLDLHRDFKQKSLKSAFKNNKNLMTKGYTFEVMNPGLDVKIGLGDQATIKSMEDNGYTQIAEIHKDKHDPNKQSQFIYLTKSPVNNTRIKSIFSLSNPSHRGTNLVDAYLNVGTPGAPIQATLDLETVKEREAIEVEKQFHSENTAPLEHNNVLIPISNDQGKTTGYRYVMSEEIKNKYLEKDNRFEVILGKMYGSLKDKVNTPQINILSIKLAKEDYDEKFANDPAGFVEISPKSSDPDLREIYNLFPDAAKKAVKDIWGRNRMMVRAELVDLIFGYRKATISNFEEIPIFNTLINNFIGKGKYKHIARTFEHYWQEGVKIVKDNIVIKFVIVLLENILSNNILLWVKGVPLSKLFKSQVLALSALNDFIGIVKSKHVKERKLSALNHKIKTATTGKQQLIKEARDLKAGIARLNDDIATNPIKELVDEGIFQSITEDVELDTDIYDAKSKIVSKLKPIIDKVTGTPIETGYRYGYLTHDTKPYQLLLKGTQYSDFIARFALYQHSMDKVQDGASKISNAEERSNFIAKGREEALADAIETFINYDIPTSKQLQWLNDMGILMFTKFLFRIQKIIFALLRDRPASSLAVYSLQQVFGDFADIPDSNLVTTSIMDRFNTPLDLLETGTEIPILYPFTND